MSGVEGIEREDHDDGELGVRFEEKSFTTEDTEENTGYGVLVIGSGLTGSDMQVK